MDTSASSTPDERLAVTIRSYEDAVDAFAERTADRSRIEIIAGRFADWVGDGKVVADVGCGPGYDCEILRGLGLRVVGLDLTLGMVQRAARDRPGHYARADMRRLPLLNRAVRGVFANASLLHIARSEVAATLDEFRRVLVPGGFLLLTLKSGTGEVLLENPYPGMSDRWFTYWENDPLDAALHTGGFEIVESWQNPSQRAHDRDWLIRICRAIS